ncbi:hypothetical protein C8R46DRAFT_987605 [Mycena filopes]|nr:hypothetical protein C8R46DRAFT_987605 [Mycena filopes]
MVFAAQCQSCGQLVRKKSGMPILPAHSSNADRRRALAKIKSQIALYEKSIAALEEEADEIEDDLSSIVYPILSLPTEITSTIFVHCLPPHGRVEPSPSRAPLLLAQICHEWREIALATSRLWSSIYIYHAPDFGATFYAPDFGVRVARNEHTSALLQTWLPRAKASPLSLGLNFENRVLSPQFLDIVLAFAGQIQRLDLHLTKKQFQELRPLLASFPYLQHLVLKNWTDTELAEFLHRTPSIRELRLLDYDHELPADLSLPRLTRLEVYMDISTTTLLRLLRDSPLLTAFSFSLRDSESYLCNIDPEPPSPLVFPTLVSLGLESGAAVWALRFLTLPALREITIPKFSDPEDVPDFIIRSSCVIDHLTIWFEHHEEGEDNWVERWLPIFPRVTILEVKECPDFDDLLDWLEPGDVMLHLEELTFDSNLTPRTLGLNYDDTLIALLHNRRDLPKCARLRKLHIRFTLIGTGEDTADRAWSLGDLARQELEELIEDGLDFFFCIETYRSGTLVITWPSSYVAQDPLPFFP